LAGAQKEQELDTVDANSTLGDVIIYANKFPESRKRVAQQVLVIKDKNTLQHQANTADILINSGSLFVQKSQNGGGSPVIRGFEASRVLLMVDGVRMNNAIYRAGHLQNIITVDNMVLDRMEVLYGPSSTIYGSDALGGVVSLTTKNPSLSSNKKITISPEAAFNYQSAVNAAKGHLNVNVGSNKWASLTAITLSSFGNVMQGNNRRAYYPNFGKLLYFTERLNNKDSAVANPNPNNQAPSGYNQVDFLQKIIFQPKKNIQHILNVQYSNTSNVPRYDRLTELTAGKPSFAEWYYGPQKRLMASYQFKANYQQRFFDEIATVVAFQDIEESRYSRRFGNNRRDERIEKLQVVSATIDAKKYYKKQEVHFGLDVSHNNINSKAIGRNIATGSLTPITTRYPDDENSMSYYAIYAQHTVKFTEKLTLNQGIRLNGVNLKAQFVDTSITKFPFSKANINSIAPTGNIGLIHASKNVRTALLLSSGFRAPNIDDITKVFDSRPGTVIVPNEKLKPEYTYNIELNINKIAGKFTYGGALFYTFFTNAIVVAPFTFLGNDSIMYSGVKSKVYANQNRNKAFINGASVNAAYTFLPTTTISGIITYTYGRFTQSNQQIPLDHIPPIYGRIAVTHTARQFTAEVNALFNGWKRLKNYNIDGEDNLVYATADGMPSWITLNAKINTTLAKKLALQFGIENIFDTNYRYFASGISAPGRNATLGLRMKL